ncbi:hypothetical protein PMAYCL1PPCAC_32297, partial [Pristionchus mayeri]
GRLSYCAYLVHFFVLLVLLDESDGPTPFVSLRHMYFTVVIPVVVLSTAFAFVWTCLVEIPFGKLEVIALDLLVHRSTRAQHENNAEEVRLETINDGCELK